MKIDAYMDLDQLAERMGAEATHEDAATMCEFLLVGDYADTQEIAEAEWLDLLNKVEEAKHIDESRS